MEQTDKKTKNQYGIAWNDFPVIGLLVAMMLSILDFPRDGVYQIIPVMLFFVLTGLKDNLKILTGFIMRFGFLGVMVAGYLLYFGFILKDAMTCKFIISATVVVFAGYCVVGRSKENLETVYYKLWVFLFAVNVLGLIKYLYDHKKGYFQAQENDFAVVVFFIVITVLYISDMRFKAAGIALSLIYGIVLLREGGFKPENLTVIKLIIPAFVAGDFKSILLGCGMLQAFNVNWKSSVNTFSSVMYDFGLIGLLHYLGLFFLAVGMAIRSRDNECRKQAALVAIMILLGADFFLIYCINTSFLIFIGIGGFLGTLTHAAELCRDKSE